MIIFDFPISNFSDIDSFSAYIGGSPTNISVCSQRLGLKTALLSAVGDDLTGKFIMDKLIKENVSTSNMFVIPNTKTNLVLCGIIPPDQFPLVFYREKAPENKITVALIQKIHFGGDRHLNVFKIINKKGFKSGIYNTDLKDDERQENLEAFKSGKLNVLVSCLSLIHI